MGTSLVLQWLRFRAPNVGGQGLVPGGGVRSHMLQLRVCMQQLKVACVATKTQCSQINRYFKNRHLKKEQISYDIFMMKNNSVQ